MKKLIMLALVAVACYYGYQHFAGAKGAGAAADPELRAALERLDGAIAAEKQAGRTESAAGLAKRRERVVRAMEAGEKETAMAEVRDGIRSVARTDAAAEKGAGGGGGGGGSLVGQQLQAIDMQQTIQGSQVTPELHGIREKARAAADAANRPNRGAGDEQ